MKRGLSLALLILVIWAGLSVGIHSLTQNNILGTDFFIFWQAGRAVLFDGANPYGDELAQQAQMAIFQRQAAAEEDQLGFAYPPYALAAILPLLYLPFDWASAVWIAGLLVAFVTAGVASFPRARGWVLPSFLLFYPVFFGVILGNYAVLLSAALLLFLGIFFNADHPPRGVQIGFGLLAGWLTVKPQFLWLYLVVMLVFALRRRLWWFLGSAAFSLVGWVLFSFILVPNWPTFWLERLTKYTAYNQAYPIATYLFNLIAPLQAANTLTLVLLALFLPLTGWLFYRWWNNRLGLLALVSWVGAMVYLFHPRGASYEHLAFLLPLVVWTCLQTNWRALPVNLFWWGSLAVSWGAFFISKQPGAPVSATEWPLLFHAVWVGWMLIQSRQVDPAQL